MNPVQKKTGIRSTTLFGLSVVSVMFDDNVDDFTARQQVYNLISESCLPRLGQVGRMDEDDVVEDIVVMSKGEDPGKVIKDLKAKITDINANSLPKDVKIEPFYDREDLVNMAVGTVSHNLV